MFDQLATQDFQRALSKASWRNILSRLIGSDNKLLPYDEFRARLPVRGQHYVGYQQVPIEKIVGSMGRYNDFDRAFLPIHERTKARWISIDKAHYADIRLPPVELIKIGDVYFVKDGNHRVSVARGRGQVDIDAFVTEVDIPVQLSSDIKMDDLALINAQGEFLLETTINSLRSEVNIGLSKAEWYPLILEHINTHRWYLGVEQNKEVDYYQAVGSWYDRVYLPLVEIIREHGLLKIFQKHTESDLYLWVIEYQKFLRIAYTSSDDSVDNAKEIAAQQLVTNFPDTAVAKLIQVVNRSNWLVKLILDEERAKFIEQTKIEDIRPVADINVTEPGKYERLLDHIATHRWYLGEQEKKEVSKEEALASWYDNVYLPIVQVIREQNVLVDFSGRTETDLYLWIVRHQWYLRELYGEVVPIEQATETFTDQFSQSQSVSPVQKVVDAIKKATGSE